MNLIMCDYNFQVKYFYWLWQVSMSTYFTYKNLSPEYINKRTYVAYVYDINVLGIVVNSIEFTQQYSISMIHMLLIEKLVACTRVDQGHSSVGKNHMIKVLFN